jgi:SAM-dependent methyltransferase
VPGVGGVALDLGCGAGYHARVLAQSGSRVVAVDTSEILLRELSEVCRGLDVVPVLAEIADSARYTAHAPFSTILCVGDTITHLTGMEEVRKLLDDAGRMLAPGGVLVLEFREQPRELHGQDAVLGVRAERDRIMQCVLHFETDRVWITDVFHEWDGERWQVFKSTYPKLRLSVDGLLPAAGSAGLQVRTSLSRQGRRVLVLGRR